MAKEVLNETKTISTTSKVKTDFFVHKKPRTSITKNVYNLSNIRAMKKKSIIFKGRNSKGSFLSTNSKKSESKPKKETPKKVSAPKSLANSRFRIINREEVKVSMSFVLCKNYKKQYLFYHSCTYSQSYRKTSCLYLIMKLN